ncbi:MAG: pyridoxal-phosphate dependent enzyme [Bacteroidota bacterium]
MKPTKAHIRDACERVAPFAHRTPVITSSLLDEITGSRVFFKCENFQKMGAFKMRGAVNAILQLSSEQQQAGVVTHSSGNFGQAVALAAKKIGVPAYIVMPENAPSVKKSAVAAYNGIITECASTLEAREKTSAKIMEETGATFLHPSNQIEVIVGNATATVELLDEQPDLEVIFTPVGGGGLIAGTVLAAQYYGKACQVVGGEPMEADDAYRSLQSGKIETNETTNTIADGLRTHLGDVNFPIIREGVSQIIRVEEEEIVAALRLLWERLKIIVEPSCAVPFAALLKEKKRFQHKKIGIILSGGNIDVENLPF